MHIDIMSLESFLIFSVVIVLIALVLVICRRVTDLASGVVDSISRWLDNRKFVKEGYSGRIAIVNDRLLEHWTREAHRKYSVLEMAYLDDMSGLQTGVSWSIQFEDVVSYRFKTSHKGRIVLVVDIVVNTRTGYMQHTVDDKRAS